VLVEGPAGIGKTALIRRYLDVAGELCVLWASGEEAEMPLAFSVAVVQFRLMLSSSSFTARVPDICQKLRHTQPHVPTPRRHWQHGSPGGLRGDVRLRGVVRTTRASMVRMGSLRSAPSGNCSR
jgi:hypothetical protein